MSPLEPNPVTPRKARYIETREPPGKRRRMRALRSCFFVGFGQPGQNTRNKGAGSEDGETTIMGPCLSEDAGLEALRIPAVS